jgi:hypothetical protein
MIKRILLAALLMSMVMLVACPATVTADTIYGYIDWRGIAFPDATVTLNKLSCGVNEVIDTAVTDINGYYTFGELMQGIYDVTPSYVDEEFIFIPTNRVVEIL